MITLAQIEQEVARRCGPYWRFFTDRQIPNTATFDFANVPELRTNADLDMVTNLYLLRRGECYDPSTVVTMDVVDRQRTVSTYEPTQGRVYPDRPWGTIPLAGEYFEFHHLNPAQELRTAVLAGLRRCFLPETIMLGSSGGYSGVDLTATLPWITSQDQVVNVQYGWYAPYGDYPYSTLMSNGHVILPSGGFTVNGLWLTVLRPAWSLVNGLDSATGPTLDTDGLSVDLDYAAAAGHIEAWHLFPARLQAAAAGGLQATQPMAAAEFTRQSLIWGPSDQKRSLGFSDVVGLRHVG